MLPSFAILAALVPAASGYRVRTGVHAHAALQDRCGGPEHERRDCGHFGVNQGQCEAKGCCWRPGSHGVPWCFHGQGPAPIEDGQCGVAEHEKQDCGFYGVKKDSCEARGCCWRETFHGGIWCFNPKGSNSTSRTPGIPETHTCDVERRADCGHMGITRQTCEAKGCCWRETHHGGVWCFHSELKKDRAPRPTDDATPTEEKESPRPTDDAPPTDEKERPRPTDDAPMDETTDDYARAVEMEARPIGELASKIAKENGERRSWRQKLQLSLSLLKDGDVQNLEELAVLQAYLTFIASGQVKSGEDGRHFRPNAHAEASKEMTALLWKFARRGDAERFITRRIFPSLPSYAEQFTVSVPMTRIRDIAHRNDIPQEMKLRIKHTLQNKLHRCADPGDLITCKQILDEVHQAGTYSQAFVKELEIFYEELKEFFNAGGLDESAKRVANEDAGSRAEIEKFLGIKRNGDALAQLRALTDLRRHAHPKVRTDQLWLLLDIELEKYAFVLLSQLANGLERVGLGAELFAALELALAQLELSGIASQETAIVAREFSAEVPHVGEQFGALRVAASADRALRICYSLQQRLEAAYAGVPALGKALSLDNHAVSVFVEAELRASVLFQLSKLVQLAQSSAKKAADLPLWTVIAAGTAYGEVVFLHKLSDAWSTTLPAGGAIVFAEDAAGDEELPQLVKGVVVPRDLPVLSHLALRARQLGAVFACTSEMPLYIAAKSDYSEGTSIQLVVDASGNVQAKRSAGGDAGGRDESSRSSDGGVPEVGKLNLDADEVIAAIDLAGLPDVAGAKASSAGQLEAIAAGASTPFKAPKGLAIPFGVMHRAVRGAAVAKALADMKAALDSNSAECEALALQLRGAVEASTVPEKVIRALQTGLPSGTDRVAVRSSANSEDLKGVSGAGLHDSVLGVDPHDVSALSAAVLKVWSSLFTLRALQSRHMAGLPLFEGIAMGVLVQPMVSFEGNAYAFIAFSKDVVADDEDSVYAELCVGLGETLASANEPGTPYRVTVQKSGEAKVAVRSLASFSNALLDKPGGPVHEPVDYSVEPMSTDSQRLRDVASAVAKVAAATEDYFGLPMDMEGVVLERASGREVYLVQARPIVEA